MSDLGFDRRVPPGGYSWWYIDAVSHDGRQALTVIAFIGSVFSPYYHHARRFAQDTARPENHVALNVALYGRPRRWCMTEHGHADLVCQADTLRIGASGLSWLGDRLIVHIDELTSPLGLPVRGRLTLSPRLWIDDPVPLDTAGRHLWHPIAPVCDVDVALDRPSLAWRGSGYLDHNRGARALEDDFFAWQWSRMAVQDGCTLSYRTQNRDHSTTGIARRIDSHGTVTPIETAAPRQVAASPIWRMPRTLVGITEAATPRLVSTLEDTPFYARSRIAAGDTGAPVAHGMHESLSLTRFTSPWVRTLLRFRMPRHSRRGEPSRRAPRARR